MAPTIIPYDVNSVGNYSGNKILKLLEFTSDPDPAVFSLFDYLPGILLLVTVFLIVFLSLKMRGQTTVGSFAAACVVNFVLTLLMYPLHIISGQVLMVGILLMPLAALLVWWTTSTE